MADDALEEFLDLAFYVEMPPVEEFDITIKIVSVERGYPDLRGLEEF